jgi:hypothetical protein
MPAAKSHKEKMTSNKLDGALEVAWNLSYSALQMSEQPGV